MLTTQQTEFLNSAYNKDNLQTNWLPLVKKFLLANSELVFEDVKISDHRKLLQSKTSYTKADLLSICFSVLQNKAIYKAFTATLPPYVNAVIERLLWEESVSKEEAESIVGGDILIPKSESYSYYGDNYKVVPGLNLLHLNIHRPHYFSLDKKPWPQQYKDMMIYVSLPPALKNILAPYYEKPQGFEIKPVSPPEKRDTQIFSAETFIIPELQRSIAYYLQGNIKYSEKGKPNAAGMNKMQRSLGITEFFGTKDFATSRTLMIAGLLHGYKSKNIQVNAVAAIKQLFDENYTDVGNRYAAVPPYVLTQLKGLGYINWHDYKKDVNKAIRDLLKVLPAGQWVTAENLIMYAKTHFIDTRPMNDWTIKSSLYYGASHDREDITASNISKLVDTPYLKGNLFLFAAFGLLDISYVEINSTGAFGSDWFSEWDGLQAVKLTQLGLYVLGLEKEYQPANAEPAGKLIFDEDSLLVRAEGDTQLMNALLGNYIEKISATRYAFNAAYFLKDCSSATDVKNKISIFKQAVGTQLPSFWDNYLQSLVSNTKAISQQTDIVVFQLSSADKTLQQLMVQDSIIKKLVLKAELFHVLVQKDNLAKFKSRMKELGYLV